MRRIDLLRHLENLKPAISQQELVPIFCNYCFGDGRVLAYNDQLAISAPADVDAEFGVHAPTLFGMLKNSRAEEVVFSLNEDILQIKVGKSNLKLPYLPKTDFMFEEPEDTWEVELDLTPDLINGLDACLLTTSKEHSLPGMMGVTVAVMDNEGVNLYSCDGDALSRYGEYDGKIRSAYTLPNEFCSTLIRLFEAGGTGTLMVNNDWAKATLSDGYTVYGRVIFMDTPYDYPVEIKNTLTTDPVYCPMPTGFNEALSRACVLGEHDTLVTIGQEKMVLVTDTNAGYIRDAFRFKVHPDMKAKVSASMMKRSLAVCGEMAVLDNCTTYRKGKQLLQIITNVGE